MKKLVLLLVLAFLQFSCSLDSPNDQFSYFSEIIPIESVDLPDEFVFGATYTINVTYRVPSSCHNYSDMFIDHQGNRMTIAIINLVIEDQNCEAFADRTNVASFDLKIENIGTYILRFWEGKDANGQDIYYTVEVPVRGG